MNNIPTPSLNAAQIAELKLAVARLLPKAITVIRPAGLPYKFYWNNPDGNTFGDAITEKEWLHVCWLAERTFTEDEGKRLVFELNQICGSRVSAYNPNAGLPLRRISVIITMPVELLLKAICHMRCPELFELPLFKEVDAAG